MNNQELSQRYQDWLYFNEDLGLYLDVSRMRFHERLVVSLEPKFAEQGMGYEDHGRPEVFPGV